MNSRIAAQQPRASKADVRHKPQIYSVGHSTRSIDAFIDLLRAHGVEQVADIRTIPKSRRNPQFNGEALKRSLSEAGIRYTHLKELGGLRRAKKDSVNLGWENESFRGFADYMATPDFHEGLQRLESIAREAPTTVMCAEAVPWRCHRSLVADALVKHGWIVKHIQSGRTAKSHKLTPFLRVRKGMLVYPKASQAARASRRRTSPATSGSGSSPS